mmetsp:Transcript_36937/g.104226  ORF Transcript_36937/g.104226 Transcript_36937/m.104226 type:complete len:209 (-) Transcript_36937:4-630(-)
MSRTRHFLPGRGAFMMSTATLRTRRSSFSLTSSRSFSSSVCWSCSEMSKSSCTSGASCSCFWTCWIASSGVPISMSFWPGFSTRSDSRVSSATLAFPLILRPRSFCRLGAMCVCSAITDLRAPTVSVATTATASSRLFHLMENIVSAILLVLAATFFLSACRPYNGCSALGSDYFDPHVFVCQEQRIPTALAQVRMPAVSRGRNGGKE